FLCYPALTRRLRRRHDGDRRVHCTAPPRRAAHRGHCAPRRPRRGVGARDDRRVPGDPRRPGSDRRVRAAAPHRRPTGPPLAAQSRAGLAQAAAARRLDRPRAREARVNAVELLPATEATPNNPRWHELRRQGVTASEIPVILGLSPWDSPWALWHRKRGLLDDPPAGESAYWGRHLEDAIADAAIDRVDPHVQMAFARGGLYCHPQRPWQMATPDRLVF